MPASERKLPIGESSHKSCSSADTEQKSTRTHYRESWVYLSAFRIACAHTDCTQNINCESTVNIPDILQLNRILSCY